ncbi:hypothetical protein LCGC14_2631930, partial [marine sediment metagenome]
AFVAGCYLLQMDRWRARQEKEEKKRASRNAGECMGYKVGDRVRAIVWPWVGEKGTLLVTDPANGFDWLVQLDVSLTVAFDREEIEPLRWWKFWRSRKEKA